MDLKIGDKRVLASKPGAPVTPPAAPATKGMTIAARSDDFKAPAPKAVVPVPTPPTPKALPIAAKVEGTSATGLKPVALIAAPAAPAPAPNAAGVAGDVMEKKAPVARVTTIEAKIDVGFGNALFLRGQGPGLNWERGTPLTCVDRTTWRWTASGTEKLKFKLLLNDCVWAQGEDLVAAPGQRVEVAPVF